MSPIQQMLLGVGAVATKTYVDDIFSTNLYIGDGASSRTITTGLDMGTEGGMTWLRDRGGNVGQMIFDTERGARKPLSPASTSAESSYPSGSSLTGWTTTGFTLGTNHNTENWSGYDYVNWNFRKKSGFFDCVKYTGDGSSSRQISHSLGSVPGMVIVKNIDGGYNWTVWHKSEPTKYAKLNANTMFNATTDYFGNSSGPITPTSTYFTVNGNAVQNGNGVDYIAYVFAGGESTEATARSVGFSSSSTYLSIPDSNDFDFGSTFTFEAWVKPEFHSGGNNLIFEHGSFQISITDAGRFNFDLNHIHTGGDLYSSAGSVPEGQWTHVAVVGTSGTLKMYINGVNDQSHNRTGVDVTGDTGAANISDYGGYYFKGEISNLRIVKGTAVYASSFRPPTEPLTNITNTVLLCCNNSSTTGSTVTPGTITANGSPTAETDSPFDDPAGFKFGDAKESVIKCGSYVGNGSSTGPEIYLGWEPQWVLIKSASGSEGWLMFDVMRGIVSDGSDAILKAHNTDAESGSNTWLDTTSTGFKITRDSDSINKSGDTYIFMCLRRSDGYVGKLPELGSDCFAMDTAASTTPNFDSGFPVDFVTLRTPASNSGWYTGSRLTSGKLLYTNASSAETSHSEMGYYDYTEAYGGGGWWDANVNQAWMWKRGAGFDVLAYKGTGTTQHINHSLNKTVEMVWFKRRNATQNWGVYHKGLNSGSNPEDYYMVLNETNSETGGSSNTDKPLASAPTSTHIEVLGSSSFSNSNNSDYIAILFASVDGISKVGSYSGNGSTGQTITLGFQPRFVIIRKYNDTAHWLVLDTTRGWGSGDDKYLLLNAVNAQGNYEVGAPTSNGFTLVGDNDYNNSSGEYIYYAHS